MLVRITALACLCLPAGFLAPAEEPAASSQGSIPEAELTTLLAELAKKAAAIQSFVATYRVDADGKQHVMVLSYEAPDRARFELRRPEGQTNLWLVDGRLTMRGEFGQGPIQAELDLPELLDLGDAFDAAVREAFPPRKDARPDLGPGPIFAMDVVADESQPSGYSLTAILAWEERRAHFLSWLAHVRSWSGARREGTRLVREEGSKSALGLSLETGFIDEIRLEKSMRLVDLRVDKDLAESVFVVPAGSANARDMTAELKAQQMKATIARARDRIYVQAAADEAGIDDAALRAKLRRAFTELHAVVMTRNFAQWIEELRARADESVRAWAEKYKERVRTDPSAREALILTATESRKSLVAMLDKSRDEYAGKLSAPHVRSVESALLGSIAAVELDGARDAFEREISAPLLAQLDEGLKAALDEK